MAQTLLPDSDDVSHPRAVREVPAPPFTKGAARTPGYADPLEPGQIARRRGVQHASRSRRHVSNRGNRHCIAWRGRRCALVPWRPHNPAHL